jgi:AcrR family transcriptional regulator
MVQAKAKPRRTQKERSDSTRQQIVIAAATCISRAGFKAATMASIAKEAGITWGAIQHHFGTKEAILDAVLDAGFESTLERFETRHLAEKSLEYRVAGFLKDYAKTLHSPIYQANLTIQRNEPELFVKSRKDRMQKEVDELWWTLFGDVKIPKKRMNEIKNYTFMTLNGIGMDVMLFDEQQKRAKVNLRILRDNLLHMLAV